MKNEWIQKDDDSKARKENRMASYFYLRDHGVETFEEFEEFKKMFPHTSDSVIFATWALLMKKHHGVSYFGF